MEMELWWKMSSVKRIFACEATRIFQKLQALLGIE